MDSAVTLADRCYLEGRMLQVRPIQAVIDSFLTACPLQVDAMSFDAIEQDYLRLFVGLGTPLAPPWESAWASDSRLVFQRETLDVRYWYRSAGLQAAALHHEPDDHIGLELEFIGRLLERGEYGQAAQFACEHPRTWADRWVAAVQDNARDPFYPALASHALIVLDMVSREG